MNPPPLNLNHPFFKQKCFFLAHLRAFLEDFYVYMPFAITLPILGWREYMKVAETISWSFHYLLKWQVAGGRWQQPIPQYLTRPWSEPAKRSFVESLCVVHCLTPFENCCTKNHSSQNLVALHKTHKTCWNDTFIIKSL